MKEHPNAFSGRPLFRREFLSRVFGALAVAGAGASSKEDAFAAQPDAQPYATPSRRTEGHPPDFKPKLRITRLETMLVKPRWLFLKVHTDEGVVGLGEPILEGRAKTCETALSEIEPYLIGTDLR